MTRTECNQIKIVFGFHVGQRLSKRSGRFITEQALHIEFLGVVFDIVPAFAVFADVKGVEFLDRFVGFLLLGRWPCVDYGID